MQDIAARLQQELGPDVVAIGHDIPARVLQDWSGLSPVQPLAWVRPRTTEEVAATLRLCSQASVTVVPQGGLTGLAGGAQPIADGVLLSLERMSGIEELDPVMATMTVLAGTPLATIQ